MTESAFPPTDLRSVLVLCAGEWLALRSSMALESASSEAPGESETPAESEIPGEEESWHRSERGELAVAWLEPQRAGDAGGLAVTPPGRPTRTLTFQESGAFETEGMRGSWQLWPDGSLELRLSDGGRRIKERIWFTKPNLRLRSSVEQRADGSPGRASFSSEIRRVSRPAAAPEAPAAPPP
ncbi:MAG: phycobiliprotein lyase [Cyanobium sp.]